METLKVKINKEKFVEIESGKNELVIGFTQALLKKISKDKSYTISDLISNKELIKHFDELCILCMFSSDMITLPIEEMKRKMYKQMRINKTKVIKHLNRKTVMMKQTSVNVSTRRLRNFAKTTKFMLSEVQELLYIQTVLCLVLKENFQS